jgi:hypothetical protein
MNSLRKSLNTIVNRLELLQNRALEYDKKKDNDHTENVEGYVNDAVCALWDAVALIDKLEKTNG